MTPIEKSLTSSHFRYLQLLKTWQFLGETDQLPRSPYKPPAFIVLCTSRTSIHPACNLGLRTLTCICICISCFHSRRPIQLWRSTETTTGMATTSATDTTKAPSGRTRLRIWPTEMTSPTRRRRRGATSSKRKWPQVWWAQAF